MCVCVSSRDLPDPCTRPRRIFTCWGDGARSIPIDPLFLGWAGVGTHPVHVDDETGTIDVQVSTWGGYRVVGHTCRARAPMISCPGSSGCRDEPPPEPRAIPVDYPRPPWLLGVVRALALALAPHELAVRPLSFRDEYIGSSAWIEIAHAAGGRGHCMLRRAWGETHVQDFAGIPAAAIDLIRASVENTS